MTNQDKGSRTTTVSGNNYYREDVTTKSSIPGAGGGSDSLPTAIVLLLRPFVCDFVCENCVHNFFGLF